MANELKPCPFCDKTVECKENEHNFVRVGTEKRQCVNDKWEIERYFVHIMRCTKCRKIVEVEVGATDGK